MSFLNFFTKKEGLFSSRLRQSLTKGNRRGGPLIHHSNVLRLFPIRSCQVGWAHYYIIVMVSSLSFIRVIIQQFVTLKEICLRTISVCIWTLKSETLCGQREGTSIPWALHELFMWLSLLIFPSLQTAVFWKPLLGKKGKQASGYLGKNWINEEINTKKKRKLAWKSRLLGGTLKEVKTSK